MSLISELIKILSDIINNKIKQSLIIKLYEILLV